MQRVCHLHVTMPTTQCVRPAVPLPPGCVAGEYSLLHYDRAIAISACGPRPFSQSPKIFLDICASYCIVSDVKSCFRTLTIG